MKVIAWARIAVIALVLIVFLPAHLLVGIVTRHSPFPAWFMALAGKLAGLRISVKGHRLPSHVLYVCNHVSWLDILALGGLGRAAFVSKAEVRDWPVVGWLAQLGGTIFVDRGSPAMVRAQADEMADVLDDGHPVALFPEGTTGDGIVLRPFKAPLFAALYPPREMLMVQPVALDYGEEAAEIAWVEHEPFGHNAMRLLARVRPIRLQVIFGDPVRPSAFPDRKALSQAMHEAISRALDASAYRHHRV